MANILSRRLFRIIHGVKRLHEDTNWPQLQKRKSCVEFVVWVFVASDRYLFRSLFNHPITGNSTSLRSSQPSLSTTLCRGHGRIRRSRLRPLQNIAQGSALMRQRLHHIAARRRRIAVATRQCSINGHNLGSASPAKPSTQHEDTLPMHSPQPLLDGISIRRNR